MTQLQSCLMPAACSFLCTVPRQSHCSKSFVRRVTSQALPSVVVWFGYAAHAMLLGIWGSLVVWWRLWIVLGPSSLTESKNYFSFR
jgi:hypothetical protein